MSEQVIVVAAGPGERHRARREARANPGALVVVRARGERWRARYTVRYVDGRLMAFIVEHSQGGRVERCRCDGVREFDVRPVHRLFSWLGYPPRWQIAYYERRLPGESGWSVVPGSECPA